MTLVKHILPNGLAVLIYPRVKIPRVALYLIYKVGSKDELDGQRGMAHLLEHMLYKGTHLLSETDFAAVTQKLSGSCNAFTTQDFTGYEFEFPSNQWHASLDLLADTMKNCRFGSQQLASEMKAVVQELKMYRDDYETTLEEVLTSLIFDAHPYHHPVIGYKHDLFAATPEALAAFYKNHYMPNNAVLVIVGDVVVDDAIRRVEYSFGNMPAVAIGSKRNYCLTQDTVAKSVIMQCDVQQPFGVCAFVIPGVAQRSAYLIDFLALLVGAGKGSRLYKKMVYERNLALDVGAYTGHLVEQDLFFIKIYPREQVSEQAIIDALREEVADMARDGFNAQEIERAHKKATMNHRMLLEDNAEIAQELGMSFLATGSERSFIEYEQSAQESAHQAQEMLNNYFKPTRMHYGWVNPLQKADRKQWEMMHEFHEKEEAALLAHHERTDPLENVRYLHTVVAQAPSSFSFPRAVVHQLASGLTIIVVDRPQSTEKIEMRLTFDVHYYNDPVALQGLNNFLFSLLLEGTQTFSAAELALAIEERGMTLEVQLGAIHATLLEEDFEWALTLLQEIITHPSFAKASLERVREQIVADIKEQSDDPLSCIDDYARAVAYKNHPYAQQPLGTLKSVRALRQADFMNTYKQSLSPQGASLVIVGNMQGQETEKIVQRIFKDWHGQAQPKISFPSLLPLHATVMNYPMQREQVAVAFVGQSVSRFDAQYDALLIADALLTGGTQTSMQSRLFQLREQTGLFYTIDGSLLEGCDDQPGTIYIKTLVSPENITKVEKLIAETLQSLRVISHEEYEEAQRMLMYGLVDYFATDADTAQTFATLHALGLPLDYFDHRVAQLARIQPHDVKRSVEQHVDLERLVRIRVGRVKQ